MSVLPSTSLKKKITLLVGVAMAGVLAMAALAAWNERALLMAGRTEQLTSAVQTVQRLVEGFESKARRGEMSLPDAQKAARDAVAMARYGGPDGKSSYFSIVGLDGTSVMNPYKPEWDGQPMIGKLKDRHGRDVFKVLVDAMAASPDGRVLISMTATRPGQDKEVDKLQYLAKVAGWPWMVVSGVYLEDVDAMIHRQWLKDAGLAAAALLVIGALGAAVARATLRQIGGEPSVAQAAIASVARGDLRVEFGSAPAGSLLHSLGEMVAALRSTIGQVCDVAVSVSTASGEIATGNDDLSRRTEQAASSLQRSAAAMEQLTGTVGQSARSAVDANALATSAAEVAERGGAVVARVMSTFGEITSHSKKIGDIIATVDGLAFQTNILALNAAVEAARAGEQGRGFAVVASEVRSLAQRSAAAAKEIKSLIGSSAETVGSGSRLVQDAGETMREILASVQRVSDVMSEITNAAGEQSAGISEVSSSVNDLDRMTQENASLVKQSAASAGRLNAEAGRLEKVIGAFRIA